MVTLPQGSPYVVLDSGDNASGRATVTIVVNIASGWWVVLSVNEVIWL